jgi:hypothetical protein
MDQTHIGYTYWNEPPLNMMPLITYVQPAEHATLGAATADGTILRPSLGQFDSVAQQRHTLTLFNRGTTPVQFRIAASAPWIEVSQTSGEVAGSQDLPVQVRIDWNTAPQGLVTGDVTVTQNGLPPMQIPLEALRIAGVTRENAQGFVESNGYVSIEAADTTTRTGNSQMRWEELPGYGETHSGMTIFPVTAASETDSQASLQYRMYLYDQGKFNLEAILSPTLNFVPGRGLRFAVSVDDGPRTIVDALEHNTQQDWAKAVSDGVRKVNLPLTVDSPGYHTLKIWAVDPGVVVEKLVLSHWTLPYSYLGPPESYHARLAARVAATE